MNNTNKRVRFTVLLSSARFEYSTVVEYLAPRLGKHFAGACFSEITGCWSEEGHLLQDSYARVNVEAGLQILVSVMPDDKAHAYAKLQSIVADLNQSLSLGLNWVHVEAEEVEALHFQISPQ